MAPLSLTHTKVQCQSLPWPVLWSISITIKGCRPAYQLGVIRVHLSVCIAGMAELIEFTPQTNGQAEQAGQPHQPIFLL